MKLFAAALAAIATQNVAAFAPTTAVGRRFSTTSIRMAETALTQDELKKMVGYKSVDDYVESGMVVGLGTGSTAYFAVERLGEKLKSGELKDILAIPTSVRTKEQAESLGIPLVTLDTNSKLDVAIDGADEVDPDLNLVKGGGGALLREKMVEVCADKFIVIGESVFHRILTFSFLNVPFLNKNLLSPSLYKWMNQNSAMDLDLASHSPLKLLLSVMSTLFVPSLLCHLVQGAMPFFEWVQVLLTCRMEMKLL